MKRKPKLTPWQQELLDRHDKLHADIKALRQEIANLEEMATTLEHDVGVGNPDIGLEKLMYRSGLDVDEVAVLVRYMREKIGAAYCGGLREELRWLEMNGDNDISPYHLNQALAKREALASR